MVLHILPGSDERVDTSVIFVAKVNVDTVPPMWSEVVASHHKELHGVEFEDATNS